MRESEREREREREREKTSKKCYDYVVGERGGGRERESELVRKRDRKE